MQHLQNKTPNHQSPRKQHNTTAITGNSGGWGHLVGVPDGLVVIGLLKEGRIVIEPHAIRTQQLAGRPRNPLALHQSLHGQKEIRGGGQGEKAASLGNTTSTLFQPWYRWPRPTHLDRVVLTTVKVAHVGKLLLLAFLATKVTRTLSPSREKHQRGLVG